MRYWPFWFGGLALAAVAVGFRLLAGRVFGVSGSMHRAVDWRERRKLEAAEASIPVDDFEAALLAATRKQFGESAVADVAQTMADGCGHSESAEGAARRPLSVDLVFLAAILVGALAVALADGTFAINSGLDREMLRLYGESGGGWLLLALGGVFVGFGTRMAGGCTSGHGLSGTARLEPASLAATASFFGAGVVVSLLMDWLRS